MKGKTLNQFILSALLILHMVPAISQSGNGSDFATREDSINCGKNLSAYRTFFNLKLYDDAFPTWLKAFNDCPASSERMYLDGVVMYRSFIEAASDGPVREGRIDTLMLIYDRRMEYFGDEGNVLGRKGRDLLNYRGGEIEEVQKAYEMFKRSIDLEGRESQEAVMLLLISSGIALNKAQIIDDNQVIEDYLKVVEILDPLEARSSRWARTRATIDEVMLREEILSCDALNRYYEPLLEQQRDDKAFLKKVITLYDAAGCDNTEIYVSASENLFRIDPGPESAHNLAMMFITRNDLERAIFYLKEAVLGENIDSDTRAEWFFKLALVSNASNDYCAAIVYAREAIAYNDQYGKAYILLGDAFIASRESLGDDFQQRTAFWAAADMYSKAGQVDPSSAEEANQKLNDYAGQYPNNEDVFFRDIKEGDQYKVGGCINENTTVRSRK